MIELYEIKGLFPNALQEGFSTALPTFSASGDAYLTGWSATSPFFSSENFDTVTGSYTVPVTGLYAVTATVSYNTNSALTASIAGNPAVIVRRTAPTSTDLISGLFPIFNVFLALFSLRSVLGGGTIPIAGVVKLTEGDTVRLFYNASDMGVALTFSKIVWSIYRLGE